MATLLKLQNTVLEMIATGARPEDTIDRLCLDVEQIVPGIVCSVLRVDANGRIRPLSAPSLPASFSQAIDGVEIGAESGSCGTAAFLKIPVAVTDIARDPRWATFKEGPLAVGLKACWSSPIINGEGRVVATFAFYYHQKRGPSLLERKIVDTCIHLCMIALERQEQIDHCQALIFTDALTGLPNRAAFEAAIANFDAHACADWGLVLVDIDNLKVTNDTFGHAAGDDLIATVAGRIAAVCGQADAFRLGGDEFAIIVKGMDARDISGFGAELLAALKIPAQCNGCSIFPSATLGGALMGDSGHDLEKWRQNADFALYHAKEIKRGEFLLYVAGLGTTLTQRFRAIHDVSLALLEDRLTPYYQPIVRLDTGDIVGFEALCRIRTPSGEIISAANFHEATKDARVASDLTGRMLSKIAADVRGWLDLGIPFQHVGINVSAADFRGGRLEERLCSAFHKANVPLKHVILEVTESVYLGGRDHVVANEIKDLRSKGLLVALDDFGTGFASLTHLLSVPVDIIKIDKSFVDRLMPDDAGTAIIEGLIGIARKLGIRVVAEGIETAGQAHELLRLGCMIGQGYHYSRAVDQDAATNLLLTRGQRLPGERQGTKPQPRHFDAGNRRAS